MASGKKGLKPVKITYAAIGGGSCPVWTAYETGIFEKNGLDVELFMIRGSGNVTDALLDGRADFGNMASPGPLKKSLEGDRDLVYLTGGINYMVQTLVSQPEIKDPKQLKGKIMGRSGDGSNLDDLIMAYIGPKLGFDPKKEIKHVHIKDQPDAFGKMERKEIDACLFTPPWLFELTNRNYNVLMDAIEAKLDFQLGGIVCSKETVARDPDVARRVVKGYVEGCHYFRRNADFAVGLQKKYSRVDDPGIARQCHDLYSHYFLKKPYPSTKGIQTVLTHLSKQIPEAAKVNPERFIDRSFLKELDDSGFIDELYKREPAGDWA